MRTDAGREERGNGAARVPRATSRVLHYFLLLAVTAFSTALSQVSPNAHWRTIATRHFLIHFTPPLEPQARRLAVNAERAYDSLSTELHPPRGIIDVVLSDDVDFTNGSATPFPSNRIVLYANPPVAESALRFTDDWNAMGITHELTHIFHLDRVRGIWRLGQWVFGRSPVLFPNTYAPSWLTEGLAVYYETRFTGAGRVAGSEHRMIARAAAIHHAFPALDQLSLAAPRYPFGEITYAYGSLFIDYLARTRGERDIGRFVDKESADLIPFWLDLPAKQAFGISFSRAWRQWSDSLLRTVRAPDAAPLPGWKPLTSDGVFVDDPRWVGDTALVYSGSDGRETYGAYRVDLAGRRERIGRRNSGSPNVLLPDGSLLFTQIDFVNPYEQRSDLYVERDGREHRLTWGARLTAPDARADGAIVAVQIVPAGTRLVRVSSDGRRITPLTAGGMDEQWTEPRWSHRGDRIAAIRWLRGGTSQIVILDTAGTVLQVVASGHSVQATPSWAASDAGVFFASDKSGSMQVYYDPMGGLTPPRNGEWLVSSAGTGLFEPQLSPDPRFTVDAQGSAGDLAGVTLGARGFQLGVGHCCDLHAARDTVPFPLVGSRPVPPVGVDSTAATDFRMWHGLLPRYWLPTIETGLTGGSVRFGALTSGSDVVGRHSYVASVAVPSDNSGAVGSLNYQYAGFGLPLLSVDASQDWEQYLTILSRSTPSQTLGEIRRRTRDANLSATWVHPRIRASYAMTVGAGVEQRAYAGVPAGTIALVDTTGLFRDATFPHVFLGAGWTDAQYPAYAISPEDGLSLAGSAEEKLRSSFTGGGSPSLTLIGVADAYKSLDLPGFAHHVLAVRAAAGATDLRADGYLEVGGTSGNLLELVPGYSIGQGQRTFGVRGFEPAALYGTRALAGSIEYRAPLFMAGRGLGMLPLFFDKTSLSLFADAGTAWCPSLAPPSLERQVCSTAAQRNAIRDLTAHDLIASIGGELDLTAAVLSWDAPYRFRLGFALPVRGRDLTGAAAVSGYFAVGLSF